MPRPFLLAYLIVEKVGTSSAVGRKGESLGEQLQVHTLAKVVATIGPASDSPEMVRKLIEAGVGIFRFNFSHGDLAGHKARLDTVRSVAASMDRPIACLGDLQGPKIRVGKVADPGIVVETGQDVIFRARLGVAQVETIGGQRVAVFPTTYEKLIDEVEAGHKVLINDGAIRMLAVDADKGKGELRCRVVVGGLVTSGKGINLPQSVISAPAITERDWKCVDWAYDNEIDFLALSFVRRAEEVLELKAYLAKRCPIGCEDDPKYAGAWTPLIAKIEKPQAVADIDRIVAAADGIMVARGDLGVEMDIARVPVAQKEIVAACAAQGKPCIVATQMLETMIENSTPTRAEASDVANAIFDGADAVMLSAETAMGKHPVLVVETMRRIIAAAEERVASMPRSVGRAPTRLREAHRDTAALAHGAAQIAADLRAKVVVCWSQNGGTARYLSQNNMCLPIVAFSSDPVATRRMALLGGVTAVLGQPPASGKLSDWNIAVDECLLSREICERGDPIVLLAGRPLGRAKATNTLAIHRVGENSAGFRTHL